MVKKQIFNKRIAIAIDKSDNNFDLHNFAKNFPKEVILKIGLEYFVKFGPRALDGIQNDIFLDLKFFDIPNTVHHAVKSACEIPNVKLLTIHAQGGRKMIESAILARNSIECNVGIVCVTKLTSESANIEDIHKLTELSLQSGADGIVCSAQEIALLRAKFGQNFIAVTPGIRPVWYKEGDDQVRICTPKEAIANGSNIIVIGRPIARSEDPAGSLAKVLEEINIS